MSRPGAVLCFRIGWEVGSSRTIRPLWPLATLPEANPLLSYLCSPFPGEPAARAGLRAGRYSLRSPSL